MTGMRFAVETWMPTYGSSASDGFLEQSDAHVELAVEMPPEHWVPRAPAPSTRLAEAVLFVDGVQRVDSRVWIDGTAAAMDSSAGADGLHPSVGPHMGVCASWAAG